MKREYIEIKHPSLDEQISEKKKQFERFGFDMVYGQEALCLLANRRRIEVEDYIHSGVGTEEYREGVISYLIAIKNHLLKKTNSDLHLIPIGTEIFINDNIDYIFASKVDNTISGVFAFYYNVLGEKQLATFTFEYLNIAFPEYSVNTFAPTGKIIYPYNEKFHDVYDKTKKCATHLDLWKVLRNSCIKVCEVIQYRDCSYWKDEVSKRSSSSSIGRIRSVPLFVFCFAHKECKSIGEYMNAPHLYHNEYRAFKNENERWGICLDKSGEVIVDCFFDKIIWGNKYVQFYKDGKIAICRIEEIENLEGKS